MTKSKFFLIFMITIFSITACQHSMPVYLASQGMQQGALFLKMRPITDVIKDPLIDPQVHKNLKLSQEVLKFASNNLGMHTGRNYQNYVHLKNPWVTHVVVAAYAEKFEAHLFKYPLFGALPYRGYFDKKAALSFAETLKAKGLDVHVRPVTAYSTTGWLPDPVLSSMMTNPLDLIEVLFHELVHLQFYIPNQADFNEAFATWFAEKATIEFLHTANLDEKFRSKLLNEFQKNMEFEKIKYEKSKTILTMAQDFYSNPKYLKLTLSEKLESRKILFRDIKKTFENDAAFSRWSQLEWNNAILVNMSTYYGLVEEIEKVSIRNKVSYKEFLAQTVQNPNIILSQFPL